MPACLTPMATERRVSIDDPGWAASMTGRKGSTGVSWTEAAGLKTDLARSYKAWMGGAVLRITPFYARHGRLPEEGET